MKAGHSAEVAPRAVSPRGRDSHPPERAVHLGLGAFHRAHQAWYTERANASRPSAPGWGIVAFTGRSAGAAEMLERSNCVYTLVERSAHSDDHERIQSIVRAVPGDDALAWTRALASPQTSLLTVTVTEAGYADNASPAHRIAAGLAARMAADAGPITVVSCDNLIANGQVLQRAVLRAAQPSLQRWIRESVSFVDTVVDRITPATTDTDRREVAEKLGYRDDSAVVCEAYSEWVLSGDFLAGRPQWERGGARFVPAIAAYEKRKLWLLNAGHTLLAAAGSLRGYTTVAEAFEDAELRALTEELWAEHRAVIDLPAGETDEWLEQLRGRFANPRIAHQLAQISRDSELKVPLRILAPLQERVRAGFGAGAAQRTAIELWVRTFLASPPSTGEPADVARMLAAVTAPHRVDAVIAYLAPQHPEGNSA